MSLEKIKSHCKNLAVWAIVGSHYFFDAEKNPYNCLWLINDQGEIFLRYDKRFCTGGPDEMEHKYYTPGRQAKTFVIKSIQCGLLICHEWRYAELYREQVKLGTQLIFQSWYDGAAAGRQYIEEGQELGSLVQGTIRGNAANNYLWISASNTSHAESCFGSFVCQPDGKLLAQLDRKRSGCLISKIDLDKQYEDPSYHWRKRAMQGILHTDVIEN